MCSEIKWTNDGDQRAAAVDIDLTRNRSTAAPLHPMVRPHCGNQLVCSNRHFIVKVAAHVMPQFPVFVSKAEVFCRAMDNRRITRN